MVPRLLSLAPPVRLSAEVPLLPLLLLPPLLPPSVPSVEVVELEMKELGCMRVASSLPVPSALNMEGSRWLSDPVELDVAELGSGRPPKATL